MAQKAAADSAQQRSAAQAAADAMAEAACADLKRQVRAEASISLERPTVVLVDVSVRVHVERAAGTARQPDAHHHLTSAVQPADAECHNEQPGTVQVAALRQQFRICNHKLQTAETKYATHAGSMAALQSRSELAEQSAKKTQASLTSLQVWQARAYRPSSVIVPIGYSICGQHLAVMVCPCLCWSSELRP